MTQGRDMKNNYQISNIGFTENVKPSALKSNHFQIQSDLFLKEKKNPVSSYCDNSGRS